MSEEKLIQPPRPAENGSTPVPVREEPVMPVPVGGDPYPAPFGEEEQAPVDLRRYALAVLRYRWLLLLAVLLGMVGAYGVWTFLPVLYTAEGNLWIETPPRSNGAGDIAPIRTGGLLQATGWIELLRTYAVLDSVAINQRLYVEPPMEYAPAFASFGLAEGFYPGEYELRIGPTGEDFTLVSSQGVFIQQGQLGVPIGENMGFRWQPAPGSFPPGEAIDFSVMSPREAANQLDGNLNTLMDRSGNFLSLELNGTDPQRLASTLNALMERHVELAAEIKRGKLDETLQILEEQLAVVEQELANAEQDLEEFRVQTISLPSDVPIVAGLQITRDPAYETFFDSRVEVESLRRDRTRLEAALASFQTSGEVRIERLEVIPSAASSTELRSNLNELVEVNSELRVLRDRYADDYPPIRELLIRKASIEQDAIPRVVRGIIDELRIRESDVQRLVDNAAAELAEIPPRTIEEGRLERRVEGVEDLYAEIRSRVETARLAAASSIPDVSILDRATVPQRPSDDRRLPLAAMVFFGCIGAAVGAAMLLDRLDARFRYAADVSRSIGLDILGSIPRIETGRGQRDVVNAAQALEAFRELRIHTGFAFGSAGPITLTITSPSAGEGKSLVSSNLAVAFAEVGRRTLLIDGDTRRGDAHRLLGRERSPGLIDYLKERSGDDIIQATDHANLDFIGSGARGVSSPELLASPRMAYFVGMLKRTYDVIIVDSPPLASGGDPLILASLTGNLALVIRTGTTDKGLTQAKVDQLSRLPIRVLGAILNDVSASDSYHSYYASYLPGYEPVPEEGEQERTLLSEGISTGP